MDDTYDANTSYIKLVNKEEEIQQRLLYLREFLNTKPSKY